ncbi:MAG: site-specific DNA-methyltransferase, partial [Actinomycetota bacterium]
RLVYYANFLLCMELDTIKCIDCIEYLKSLPDDCVDLVLTDPPYNVSQRQNMTFGGRPIIKNFGEWDYGFDPKPVLKELKRVLKPTGQIFVFCSTKQIPEYMAIFEQGWFFRNLLVWSKTNPVPRLSKTNFLFANEYIIYAINEKVPPGSVTFNFKGQREMKNIFITPALQGKERLKDENGKTAHPTQKPLSILKTLIEIASNPRDVVLDPFMGVGSTAVAAKETGRKFLGCEFDEKYVDYAKKRLKTIN